MALRQLVATKLSTDEVQWLDDLGNRLSTTSRSETLRYLVRHAATNPPRTPARKKAALHV